MADSGKHGETPVGSKIENNENSEQSHSVMYHLFYFTFEKYNFNSSKCIRSDLSIHVPIYMPETKIENNRCLWEPVEVRLRSGPRTSPCSSDCASTGSRFARGSECH